MRNGHIGHPGGRTFRTFVTLRECPFRPASAVDFVVPTGYNCSMSNSVTYLFDLDDTLADTSSMRDGIARPIDEQMERMSVAPSLPLADLAASLSQDARVIIITARTDAWFTRAQVARYGIAADFLFRADGDNRSDDRVKADHVLDLLDAGENIVCAFDDKADNVTMFRALGVPAVQV